VLRSAAALYYDTSAYIDNHVAIKLPVYKNSKILMKFTDFYTAITHSYAMHVLIHMRFNALSVKKTRVTQHQLQHTILIFTSMISSIFKCVKYNNFSLCTK